MNKKRGYGQSAIINGDTVYSTDGNPVKPDAICTGNMTVRQVVTKVQEENRGDRALDILTWFSIPIICIFIFLIVRLVVSSI